MIEARAAKWTRCQSPQDWTHRGGRKISFTELASGKVSKFLWYVLLASNGKIYKVTETPQGIISWEGYDA